MGASSCSFAEFLRLPFQDIRQEALRCRHINQELAPMGRSYDEAVAG